MYLWLSLRALETKSYKAASKFSANSTKLHWCSTLPEIALWGETLINCIYRVVAKPKVRRKKGLSKEIVALEEAKDRAVYDDGSKLKRLVVLNDLIPRLVFIFKPTIYLDFIVTLLII